MRVKLPGDRFAHCLAGHGGRRGVQVVPHDRDTEGLRVRSVCLRALHCIREPSIASLPNTAVLVDDKVVTNVAPAAGYRLVVVDVADLLRNLGLGVVVVALRVVNNGTLDGDRFWLPRTGGGSSPPLPGTDLEPAVSSVINSASRVESSWERSGSSQNDFNRKVRAQYGILCRSRTLQVQQNVVLDVCLSFYLLLFVRLKWLRRSRFIVVCVGEDGILGFCGRVRRDPFDLSFQLIGVGIDVQERVFGLPEPFCAHHVQRQARDIATIGSPGKNLDGLRVGHRYRLGASSRFRTRFILVNIN